MPSGWTRFLLERFEFPFTVVCGAGFDDTALRTKYDVIVMPSGAAFRAGGGFGGRGGGANTNAPRVLLSFPTDPNDMLLSGVLVGGEALSGRAVAVDAPIGQGHVVMFANRPFWRWQTQGNFFLGFNTILNWNDLDAGRSTSRATSPAGQ
jgi:hypothetical protein